MKKFQAWSTFLVVWEHLAWARNWRDVAEREDPARVASFCLESSFASVAPTASDRPSVSPSVLRSSSPSTTPSVAPSARPSGIPSPAPSTSSPTFAPTAPRPSSSFAYNPHARHGPPNWGKVDVENNEFQQFEMLNAHKNRCESTTRAQSPVDLVHNSECVEHHQIRTRRGDFNLTEVEFSIRPNALRMEFPRNTTVVTEDGVTIQRLPPQADASNGWSHFPVKHVEIKTPSEHSIYGKRYPAEITIVHAAKKRVLTVAVLVEVGGRKKNPKLEVFLREWRELFDERNHACADARRPSGRRRTRSRPTPEELRRAFGDDDDDSRRLNDGKGGTSDFPLYSFLPTVWFFGYRGSLTVPPCTTVHWRVLERPVQVSQKQMDSIRNMILHQLDDNCRPSTAAFDGGVNRPTQDSANVPVWHCTDRDYPPDRPEKWPYLEPVHFEERDY